MKHKKWIAAMTLVATASILTHLPVLETDAAAQFIKDPGEQGNSYPVGTVSGNVVKSVSENAVNHITGNGNMDINSVSGNGSGNASGNASNSTSDNATGTVIGSTVVVGNHAMVMIDPAAEKVQQGYTDPGSYIGGAAESVIAETENGEVPEWEYYRNQSVNAITIPEGTTQINRFAFSRSSVQNVTIPEGITTIGYAAFYHCDDLKNVVLPETVTKVGAKAFTHTGWMDEFEQNSMDPFLISRDILVAYKGNQSEVTIPDGVRVIADEVFHDHTELKKVHLPASVRMVGDNAFPEGVEIINE